MPLIMPIKDLRNTTAKFISSQKIYGKIEKLITKN